MQASNSSAHDQWEEDGYNATSQRTWSESEEQNEFSPNHNAGYLPSSRPQPAADPKFDVVTDPASFYTEGRLLALLYADSNYQDNGIIVGADELGKFARPVSSNRDVHLLPLVVVEQNNHHSIVCPVRVEAIDNDNNTTTTTSTTLHHQFQSPGTYRIECIATQRSVSLFNLRPRKFVQVQIHTADRWQSKVLSPVVLYKVDMSSSFVLYWDASRVMDLGQVTHQSLHQLLGQRARTLLPAANANAISIPPPPVPLPPTPASTHTNTHHISTNNSRLNNTNIIHNPPNNRRQEPSSTTMNSTLTVASSATSYAAAAAAPPPPPPPSSFNPNTATTDTLHVTRPSRSRSVHRRRPSTSTSTGSGSGGGGGGGYHHHHHHHRQQSQVRYNK